MRTAADLQSAFRELEEVADSYGTPDFKIPMTDFVTPTRSGRPRVLVSALAVAACVIAVVAIALTINRPGSHADHGTVIPPGSSGASTPPPTSTPPVTVSAPKSFDLRSLWFAIRPMSGVVVSGVTLFADSQQVQLDTGAGQHWDVTLGAAGAPAPQVAAGSQPISIGGRPGSYGYLSGLSYATQVDQPVGLMWEYAPGAWATVVSADQVAISSTDATTVANAVVPGQPHVVAVPIKVGVAPPGSHLQGYEGGIGGSRPTQHGTAGTNALIDFTAGSGTSFSVALGPRYSSDTTGTATTIEGRTAYVMTGVITIPVDSSHVVTVSEGPNGPTLTAEQLLTVAKSVEFASNLQDQTTWFDSTVALP